MTQPSRILWFAFSLAALLFLPRAAAQLTGEPAPFGFKVKKGLGISRWNAGAVDSKNVYFASYYLGGIASGRPGQVMYEPFPLVFGCQHLPCGFVPPTPMTVEVIGPIPTNIVGPNTSLFAHTISIAVCLRPHPLSGSFAPNDWVRELAACTRSRTTALTAREIQLRVQRRCPSPTTKETEMESGGTP
jgi:hypothetical protein